MRIVAVFLCLVSSVSAADYSTENFVVTAGTPAVAETVAKTAETQRKSLAILWFGEELPKWTTRCKVRVEPAVHSSGYTKFAFSENGPKNWEMVVRGTPERVVDSVIPHEVSHTVFATHFNHAIPRWADEGAATLAEAEVERRRVEAYLPKSRLKIREILGKMEYPEDQRQMLQLYAEGYSLTDFYVEKFGRRKFVQLLKDVPKHGWDSAIERTSGFKSIELLEEAWRR